MMHLFLVVAVAVASIKSLLRRSLYMDRGLSVYERLEQKAMFGRVECELNLYKRQAEKLLNEGFAVQRGNPVAGWHGQYRCKIGWRYAFPHTPAWDLLEIAVSHNDELRASMQNDEESGHVNIPYDSGWAQD